MVGLGGVGLGQLEALERRGKQRTRLGQQLLDLSGEGSSGLQHLLLCRVDGLGGSSIKRTIRL